MYRHMYVCTFVRVLLNLYPAYLNALHTYIQMYIHMYAHATSAAVVVVRLSRT